jgi:hypothetical protein
LTVLTEREKQELLEMASSPSLRQEFHALRRSSRPQAPRAMDLDNLMRFLTFMSAVAPVSTRLVRQPLAYSRLYL